ncbi:MAG: response regulator, partial [Muribaculaceae bacterium]|nr:response regulator [Muribaculaceae bacterium]
SKIVAVLLLLILGYFFVSFYIANRKHRMMKQVRKREREFFINASHRLRTPLTLIGTPVVEVLNSENLSDTGRKHLEKVSRSANSMLDIVNMMLLTEFENSDVVSDDSIPWLSAAELSSAKEAMEAQRGDDENSKGPRDKEVTILIVEDNADLRHFLRDILSSQYNIITAINGKDGLEKAEKEQPDFIITDVTMPEMDGLAMVHQIKERKKLSHIPIIILSAKASMEDRMEGLKAGIEDYITKPFSATFLRQRIANIISQRRLLQQAYFEQLGTEMQKADLSPTSETNDNASSKQAQPRQEYRLDAPQIIEADQVMMEKLMKFIEERIGDETLRIEEMADAMSMGRTVFYGKIKAIVGMSPSDFLRRLRMQRAEELITRSKMNFSQIAFSVGFSDPKYFTKCFKKETGMTPSEYRHKKQEEQSSQG